VVQWGLAYVAGAWAFLQGLGYAGATFHWPDQVQQLSTLALLAGLPVVLVLAWFHGDRGEQRAGATEITIIALLLLGGGALLWLYDPVDDAPAPAAVTASSPATSAAVSDARPSIAVLPFENRSRLEEHAFFVDGIHDDILTQLSKVSALRVISRTSVERFRKTDLSVQQIAEQLGVKSVLEGGVQRAGNRVRINVQLIDATTDAHSWAEVYDRELTVANMFAIQSEVAAAIAGALKTALTPAEAYRRRARRGGTVLSDRDRSRSNLCISLRRSGRRDLAESRLQRPTGRARRGQGAAGPRPGTPARPQPRRGPCDPRKICSGATRA
jgi:TolB-like protein